MEQGLKKTKSKSMKLTRLLIVYHVVKTEHHLRTICISPK